MFSMGIIAAHLIIVLASAVTLPEKCLEKLKDDEVTTSAISGDTYVCFVPDSAKCFLQMKINYPKLELNIDKLEELSSVYKKQIEKVVDINENMLAQNELFSKEIEGLKTKLDRRDSFWSSPQLWFWVGVVVGGGVVYGSVKLAKEL